ncbi:minor tail protein [Gordonia phage Terapin]|uniref:Minor tail protein n=4 Tax=Terapinvirus terapin TaxID=2734283 RepID=A0A345MB68_9CAUD|nr:minor tail protein [Gordonia phage Terapin]AOE44841.1 minor tail protein [Gordonia phage Terapin]AXH67739.1 minor tail protein [Gordonia phage Beyoncage]QOC56598.1 hypothetical protein SEA_BITESIZE_28 [Gordonia phage BiteSize]
MIGAAFRRRKKNKKDPVFVQAASDAKSNANATVVMTTGTGKLIIGLATNSTSGLSLQVDGVTVAPIGSVTSTRIHLMYIVDVAAGEHTINSVGGGSWRTLIVAEYSSVTNVGSYTSAVSSSGTAALTPTGSGKLCVAFIANASAHTATSDDIIRRQQAGVSTTYSAAFVENTVAPLNLATSGAWSAGGVWLS